MSLASALVATSTLMAASAAGQESEIARIMPLGDSITESFDGRASYRYFLWHQLVGRGYAVDFVGSMKGVFDGTPLYPDFDQDHEGHCGRTAAEVPVEIGAWVSSAGPYVVLVHLGTNDVSQGRTTESVVSDLGGIVDAIHGHNPQAVVTLAQITPASGREAETEALVVLASMALVRRFLQDRGSLAAHNHSCRPHPSFDAPPRRP